MSYCTLAEAQTLIPTVGIGSTGTLVTAVQATAIVDAIDAELDMHLRARGYATPTTDTEALASLKTACMYGAAAGILKAAFPASDGLGGDGGAAEFWETKYQAQLALIDAGALSPDAGTTATAFAHGFGNGTETGEAPF